MKHLYFKISHNHGTTGWHVDPSDLLMYLQDATDENDGMDPSIVFTIEPVQLTDSEFAALPQWDESNI